MTVDITRSRFDEKKIDEIFVALDQCHMPGGAVAIAIGGVPVYRKGFGLANLELPALLSPTMRMRIGSTTKHFAALAYLLLCEAGQAGIDDPIERHVPGIHAVAHGITMRQLMGHIGGLRDILAITMMMHGPDARLTDAEMLAFYSSIDDADFAPGTAWSYNNGGYMLLTAAIEHITGSPLETVLRSRIFQPLGMNDTLLRRWDTDFVPNSATLHMIDAHGHFTRDTMGMEITGAGGIVSTMDDMLIWLRHMDRPMIGSAETWRLMREPTRLPNGQSTDYGMGLMLIPYRGVETVMHGGTVMGGNSQMIKVPSAGLDISVAVNRADANAPDLAFRIIDLLVEGLEAPGEKPEWDKINAVYVSPTSGRVVMLSVAGEMQLMSVDGGAGIPVEPDHAGHLQLPVPMRLLQTSFAPDGASGRLVEFANEDIVERIEPDREAVLANRAGGYQSAALAATAVISDGDGDGASLVLQGRHGRMTYRLDPLTHRIWRASALGAFAMLSGIITFDEDGQGFDFTAGRMPHIHFVRL